MNFKATLLIRSESKKKAPWLLYYSLTEAHTPLIVEKEFRKKSIHGNYGDTIIQMDAMIGRVLDSIDEVKSHFIVAYAHILFLFMNIKIIHVLCEIIRLTNQKASRNAAF